MDDLKKSRDQPKNRWTDLRNYLSQKNRFVLNFRAKKSVLRVFLVVFQKHEQEIGRKQGKMKKKSYRLFFRGSSLLRNGLSYNLDLWCIITRMWDLIWVSIHDFSKKAVFLAENARFSRKNGVMTFFYIFLYGSYFFLRKSCIFLCSVF